MSKLRNAIVDWVDRKRAPLARRLSWWIEPYVRTKRVQGLLSDADYEIDLAELCEPRPHYAEAKRLLRQAEREIGPDACCDGELIRIKTRLEFFERKFDEE
jgi:hypothetical protein